MKYFSRSFVWAVVSMGGGVALVFFVLWWMIFGVPVTGTAGPAEYRRGNLTKKRVGYKVQVHFVTKEGQSKTVAIACSFRDSYPEGSSVPVRYDPKNPGNARLNVFWDLWAWALVSMTIGGLSLFDFQQEQKRALERGKSA
ncbi:DUF3592 domain-containing protein [Roseimicrobium sp. ORNL1]|uniref:DUF3592 domain-containing protein n=1 Tax=Roseimicrobium sp. ORNL1 TaxID=2711231 RepID=UPI0013E19F50|nr:DUF3592 domain-containing protein [Roseimicrobium sp. ORNL1]QIF00999.1 hypothetical protein G5S37_05525 [Roseimicrobium sp. ORNL1]